MLAGRYQHTLDAKGRLTIPAQFRTELTDGLYLTIGFKDCLLLYPKADFDALVNKLKELPSADEDVSDYKELVIGNAFYCELDSMGRILIPPVLRAEINLEQEADVVGQVTYIEIWRSKLLDAITKDVRSRGKQILKNLSLMGV